MSDNRWDLTPWAADVYEKRIADLTAELVSSKSNLEHCRNRVSELEANEKLAERYAAHHAAELEDELEAANTRIAELESAFSAAVSSTNHASKQDNGPVVEYVQDLKDAIESFKNKILKQEEKIKDSEIENDQDLDDQDVDWKGACELAKIALQEKNKEIAALSDELSACTESPGGCGYWRQAAKLRSAELEVANRKIENQKRELKTLESHYITSEKEVKILKKRISELQEYSRNIHAEYTKRVPAKVVIPPIIKRPEELRALGGISESIITLSEQLHKEWREGAHCCGLGGFDPSLGHRCPGCERDNTKRGF